MIIKQYIHKFINPSQLSGKILKFNNIKYTVGEFIGFGEHRFVFKLYNLKDKCSLFNLLVFRRLDSYSACIIESQKSDKKHKKMQMYYIKDSNCALRERKEIYELIEGKTNIPEFNSQIINYIFKGKYNKTIELFKKCRKTSYNLILLAVCYKKLNNEKKYFRCLNQLKKIDSNFNFSKLLDEWVGNIESSELKTAS